MNLFYVSFLAFGAALGAGLPLGGGRGMSGKGVRRTITANKRRGNCSGRRARSREDA